MPKIQKQNPQPTRPAKVASIIDGIQAIEDAFVPGDKTLITGDTGTGKTTLACDWPKPLLLIRPFSIEDGFKSVREVPGIDVTPQLTTPDQLITLVDHAKETKKWKTIVLDGVQFYQDLCMQLVLGLKDVPAQLSWGIATQNDWGTIGVEFKERVKKLLELASDGTKIVLTGGERLINEDKQSEIMRPKLVVALTPSSAGWLNFCCDPIVALFKKQKMRTVETKIGAATVTTEQPVKGVEYCAYTGPDTFYTTKFRISRDCILPDYLVNPSYVMIQKLVDGKRLDTKGNEVKK